jgi:hypothetical protein
MRSMPGIGGEAMTCERCEFIESEYVRRLREFVADEADEDCHYGDNCPSNAGTRHGTCRSCKARQTLAECHSRADSGHVARDAAREGEP